MQDHIIGNWCRWAYLTPWIALILQITYCWNHRSNTKLPVVIGSHLAVLIVSTDLKLLNELMQTRLAIFHRPVAVDGSVNIKIFSLSLKYCPKKQMSSPFPPPRLYESKLPTVTHSPLRIFFSRLTYLNIPSKGLEGKFQSRLAGRRICQVSDEVAEQIWLEDENFLHWMEHQIRPVLLLLHCHQHPQPDGVKITHLCIILYRICSIQDDQLKFGASMPNFAT